PTTPNHTLRSRGTIPNPLPSSLFTFLTVWDAACCAVKACIASQADLETTSLMAISPTPRHRPWNPRQLSLRFDLLRAPPLYLQVGCGLCSGVVSGFSKSRQDPPSPAVVLPVSIDGLARQSSGFPLATQTRPPAVRHCYGQ